MSIDVLLIATPHLLVTDWSPAFTPNLAAWHSKTTLAVSLGQSSAKNVARNRSDSVLPLQQEKPFTAVACCHGEY